MIISSAHQLLFKMPDGLLVDAKQCGLGASEALGGDSEIGITAEK
jgi:hypothetical protein